MEPSKQFKFQYKKDIIPSAYKNRPGIANPHLYITIHDTGNDGTGAGALNHAKYIKNIGKAGTMKSWHYTVDDTYAVQHLPVDETAFHAGDGTGDGNRKSIGIEICRNRDGNLLRATDNAAALTGWLCYAYKIPVENIVQHYRWTKKDCPALLRSGRPYTWLAFLQRVQQFIEDERRLKTAWNKDIKILSGTVPKGIHATRPAIE